MGKFCIIRKSLVNKGLAMLQMLVAKSGAMKKTTTPPLPCPFCGKSNWRFLRDP